MFLMSGQDVCLQIVPDALSPHCDSNQDDIFIGITGTAGNGANALQLFQSPGLPLG